MKEYLLDREGMKNGGGKKSEILDEFPYNPPCFYCLVIAAVSLYLQPDAVTFWAKSEILTFNRLKLKGSKPF